MKNTLFETLTQNSHSTFPVIHHISAVGPICRMANGLYVDPHVWQQRIYRLMGGLRGHMLCILAFAQRYRAGLYNSYIKPVGCIKELATIPFLTHWMHSRLDVPQCAHIWGAATQGNLNMSVFFSVAAFREKHK